MKSALLASVLLCAAAAPAAAQVVIQGPAPEWYRQELDAREQNRNSGRSMEALPPAPRDAWRRPERADDARRAAREPVEQSSKPAARYNVWARSLMRRHEDCQSADKVGTLVCAAAASRWCQEDGYVGGYIVEFDSGRGLASVVCN